MKLLTSKLYDPATAASHSTADYLAMTAIDTTNLRVSFTVPNHGAVKVYLSCVIGGANSSPQVLFGMMNGSTVVCRKAPRLVKATSSTDDAVAFTQFTVSGLTPGPVNWDVAYSVEDKVNSTSIKYGGPNDATANNAYGGFLIEVWDVAPPDTTAILALSRITTESELIKSSLANLAKKVSILTGQVADYTSQNKRR